MIDVKLYFRKITVIKKINKDIKIKKDDEANKPKKTDKK